MRSISTISFILFFFSFNVFASEKEPRGIDAGVGSVSWKSGENVESFWMKYARSKGGLTWGKSASYPEYEKVKEGDTLLIQLKQGPCLMEFFHSRWRRANDVRRWDDSINK